MTKTKKQKATNFSQAHSFFSVLKFFNKYYWKSGSGPSFAFGMSLLLYAMLGGLMGYKEMLAPAVGFAGLAQGLTALPFSIMSIKNSVLMKRIGATPIKTWVFSLVIIFYFFTISLITTFYLMIWGLIFTQDTNVVGSIYDTGGRFFTFIYGWFLNIGTAIALGVAISVIAKTPAQAQSLGMLIYFPGMFLSGQAIAPNLIATSDALNAVSKAIPFRYSTMMMVEPYLGSNPFDIDASTIFYNGPEKVTLYTEVDHIMGLFYPQVLMILGFGFSSIKFKWTVTR